MSENKNAKPWGIASLCGSLFFPTLSIVAGIFSLIKGRNNADRSHAGFAIGGIVVGSINIITRISIFGLFVIGLIFGGNHLDLPPAGAPHANGYSNDKINDNCSNILFDEDSFISEEALIVACQVINMDEKSAVDYIASKGMLSRIAVRDDESFAMTMDYRNNRINLFVKHNRVYDSNVG